MATKWSEIKHKGEDTPEKRERLEQLREEIVREQDEFERTGVDPYERTS